MDDTLRAVLAAAQILEELDVRWFLGGSLASSVHGIPRATFDADMMADLRSEHVRPLIQKLGDDWYADEEAMRQAISHRSSFNLIHLETAMKVGVFLPKPRLFDDGEFGRSRRMPVAEASAVEACVCCAEDIVIAKLEWYRLGGENSGRQWADVLGVLRLNAGQLDRQLMRESAREVGVHELMKNVIPVIDGLAGAIEGDASDASQTSEVTGLAFDIHDSRFHGCVRNVRAHQPPDGSRALTVR